MPPPVKAVPLGGDDHIQRVMDEHGLSREEAEAYIAAQGRTGRGPVDPVGGILGTIPVVGGSLEGLVSPGAAEDRRARQLRNLATAQADAEQMTIPGAPPGGAAPTTVSAAGVRRPRTTVTTPQLQADGTVTMPGEGYQYGPEYVTQGYDVTGDIPESPWGEGVYEPEGLHTLVSEAGPDPLTVEAQRRALSELTGIVDQGGLTAVDRARIADTQRSAGQFMRGAREATLANMEARGMRGGGAELMSQLSAQQAAGDRMSRENMQTTAQAQQRALQALGMLGGQAGQVRGQSYGESLNRAQAGDQMNRYNQQMIDNWRRYQQDEAWRRYGAQRDASAAQYNRRMGEADRVQLAGQRQQDRRDAQIGAGIGYLTGGAGGAAASQQGRGGGGGNTTAYRPGSSGYPRASDELYDPWRSS